MSIQAETPFLDFLREAEAWHGRGNDELVRAVVPLLQQALEHHDEGRVAPLVGVDRIFADGGHLWFHDDEAKPPQVDKKALRQLELREDRGVEVVDRTTRIIDIDARSEVHASRQIGKAGDEIKYPVYLPDYVTWEQELGHHDALTDVFALGMLLASLAIGADFTDPSDLERFVIHRNDLTQLNGNLHPVIAKAIVRMTELERKARAQDLIGLIERISNYRDVDPAIDQDVDFRKLKGFNQADRGSRRKIIQAHLQSRLFDMTKRNRLIWFRSTLQTLDLTETSVPTSLNVENISLDDLMLWQGAVSDSLSHEKPVRLDRFLRLEETPYAAGILDKIRSQARRDMAEFGASQLRLVIAFFNWHNLRDAPEERVRSPLLLLPVTVEKKRGVRDSYQLKPQSDVAEVNPALRHQLMELYELQLPESVDLSETDLDTFHAAVAAEVVRSEPGITVHKLTRPQIRLVHERARRRLAAYKRRSRVSGRGVRRFGDVSYSYTRTNFQPLGLQLFLRKVKPEILRLEEHYKSSEAAAPPPPPEPNPAPETEAETEGVAPAKVKETSREVYQITEEKSGKFDWAVDLTHLTLGNFNYRKMSLVRDYDEILDEEDGHEHPAFDTLFSLDARDIESPPDAAKDPLAPYIVVPADPTQTAAVQWAREGRNFIIQGPPGTGKSQTITNLISDFAGRGKRVLFVCAKRAALDVVFHRLAQHGLDEISVLIHDSQADKKAFLTELGGTYNRWLSEVDKKAAEEGDQASVRSKLEEPLEALGRFSEAMTGPAHGAQRSVADVLRERLVHGPSDGLAPEHKEWVPSHESWMAHRQPVLDLGAELSELGESTDISQLPLRQISARVLESERPLSELKDGLSEIESHLDAVKAAQQLVGEDATADDLAEALVLAREVEALLDAGGLTLLDRQSSASKKLDESLDTRRDQTRALTKAKEGTQHWTEKLSASDLSTALTQAQRFEKIFVLFLFFIPAWWRLRKVLAQQYDFAQHTVKPAWTDVLGALDAEYRKAEALSDTEGDLRQRFSVDGDLDAFVERLEALRGSDGRTSLQLELRKQWAEGKDGDVRALLDASAQIDALAESVQKVFDDSASISVDALSEQVRRARAATDLLPSLRKPLAKLSAADKSVKDAVRHVPVPATAWDSVVAETTLERTFSNQRPLAKFDHDSLERRQSQLRDNYDGWLESNADIVRTNVRRRFVDKARVCNLTAAQLTPEQKVTKKVYNAGRRVLEREFKKVMRHRSIRELSSGDSGTVLYDLKPVWLMSPLSISDTIPLEEERFDVVIFDEASQIPLEEAVPALYRAPQMIVVGDEMQLPPTTFFSSQSSTNRSDDDELPDEREAHYDLDADSFLSHSARKLPSTMLGWHYRSRSESLIRFSNHAFYEGKLLTVPDRTVDAKRPRIVAEKVGDGDVNAACVTDRAVSFHKLSCGLYQSRRNPAEARYIAHLVRGLLNADHRHSIGIVAFSEAQQDEIDSALRELARLDEDFQRKLEAEIEREEDGQLVGLFVKNLENVQGDERDIIILSICYAPGPNGKMRMNFGPINKGGGEKRLNVVFSRAKRHMAVVSTIEYSAITNEYNEGAQCFRRYLQYAEAMSRGDEVAASVVTQALERHASEVADVDDPVVDGLAEALTERGSVVEPNVGASAFMVDLAVRKPDSDRHVVGVLVDTAQHYENDNLLERYHTRPAVLTGFGWTVVWILAKDWLEDPDGCLRRIEDAYEQRPDEAPTELLEKPDSEEATLPAQERG